MRRGVLIMLPLLALVAALSLIFIPGGKAPPDPLARGRAVYADFKARYIQPDGRVVDPANKGITHTEGLGYALLMAEAFDDPATFQRVYGWLRATLPPREDGLLPWRWDPSSTPPITDRNAASDGDLLIAWALARAGRRWQAPVMTKEAARIARALRRAVIREAGGLTLFLAGPDGFDEEGDKLIVNPSYWVFPALAEMAALDPDPAWSRVQAGGRALLRRARFGPDQVVPDWVTVAPDGTLGLPTVSLKAEYGYNAVRVPLNLAWGGLRDPADYAAVVGLWRRAAAEGGRLPMVMALPAGVVQASLSDPDFALVHRLGACAAGDRAALALIPPPGEAPPANPAYFGRALAGLTWIAAAETGLGGCLMGASPPPPLVTAGAPG